MSAFVNGLHHVTTMTRDAQANVDFYTQVLGLRMIKVTVNFDDPSTYHLYYGDGAGTPGSAITFFPWSNLAPRRPGVGEIETTAYTIPTGSQDWWLRHLKSKCVQHVQPVERFGEPGLRFSDEGGSSVELIESEAEQTYVAWRDSPVPAPYQIRGFHGATAWVQQAEPTANLLTEVFGLEILKQEGTRQRFGLRGKKAGTHFDLVEKTGHAPARHGCGTVHHLAWRVPDDAAQDTLRERVLAAGFNITPRIDRQYFHSLYFRERNGLLFEIATDPPGFTADGETLDTLGTRLQLPPQYENQRALIEDALPPLRYPEPLAQDD